MKWYDNVSNYKTILYILLIVIVGFSFVFVYLKYRDNAKSGTKVNNKGLLNNAPSKSTNENLLVYGNNENSGSIRTFNLQDKTFKLIFSDTDESFKINRIGGYANLIHEILISVTENEIKTLKMVNTDNSEIKNISSIPISYSNLSISPDGQNILFISTDEEKQSLVFQMNVHGSNLRQMYKTKNTITDIAWNNDLNEAYFIAKNQENTFSILSINLNNLTTQNIYTTQNIIYSLYFNDNNYIVFNENNGKNVNSGLVAVINLHGNDKKILFETTDYLPDSPVVSSDLNVLGFIKTNYQEKYEEDKSGDTSFMYIGFPDINVLDPGNLILGFFK